MVLHVLILKRKINDSDTEYFGFNPCDAGPVYTRERVTVLGGASRVYTGITLPSTVYTLY